MSIFSDLTPEQKKLTKNCKSKEELNKLLKGFTALAEEKLTVVSGGDSEPDIDPDSEDWRVEQRRYPHWGDVCKDVKTENVSSDFATGKITGVDFFA